jgi:membrane protease YdiL (CAAX protease family)
MPTLIDFVFVAMFAVGLPLWDYLYTWPVTSRRLQADPASARKRLWIIAIVCPWALVAAGSLLWISNEHSWAALGLSVPDGWRLWTALGLVVLVALYQVQSIAAVAREAQARDSVRQQFTGSLAEVLPRTRGELNWFAAVSLTAGFCEEFLYRGFFVWALAPWVGWWGAATISLVFFAVGHAYQGWMGILRTGIVGAVFTGVVALTGSLWPAMMLHALMDLGGGVMAWLVLRESGGQKNAT